MRNAFHFANLIFKTFSTIFKMQFKQGFGLSYLVPKKLTLQIFNFQTENPLGSVGINFLTLWENA
jgi:hypothetical protein